jgi:hypothetical protein
VLFLRRGFVFRYDGGLVKNGLGYLNTTLFPYPYLYYISGDFIAEWTMIRIVVPLVSKKGLEYGGGG